MKTEKLLILSLGVCIAACQFAGAVCSSPNVTGSTFTTATGIILSDADGNGTAATYGAGESCSWTVTCPSGNVLLSLTGSMSGSADQVLQVGASQSFTGSLNNLEVLAQAGTTTLTFTTGTATQLPSYGLPSGWTAAWSCLASTCMAPNATGTVYSSVNGLIESDQDASGSSVNYALGQSCEFHIQCPRPASGGTYRYIALYPLVSIQAQHTLEVRAGHRASGTLLDTLLSEGRRSTQIHEQVNLTLVWDTTSTAARRSDFGWSVGYTCMKHHCSSSSSPSGGLFIPTAAEAVISSDLDGSGTTTYAASESCQWDIDCPVGYQYLKFYYTASYRSGSDSLVISIPGTTTSLTLGAGSNQYLWRIAQPLSTSASTSQLEFTSAASAPATGSGFTFSARCVESSCSSPTRTPTFTNQLSGSLLSDPDGVGDVFSITEQELCAWTVQCPSGHDFAITKLLGNYTYSSYLKVTYKNGTWGNSSSYTASSSPKYAGKNYLPSTVTKGQSVVYQGWNQVEITFENSAVTGTSTVSTYNSATGKYTYEYNVPNRRVGGYSLDWACLPVPCLANVSSGTNITDVQSGGDILLGTNESDYATLGSSCNWTFALCPGGQYPEISYKYLGTGGTASSSYYTSSKANDAVAFSSIGSTPPNLPLYLHYYCYNRSESCSSPNASTPYFTNELNGTILSDPDGVENKHLITESEECDWTIQCPSGYHFAVTKFLSNFTYKRYFKVYNLDTNTYKNFYYSDGVSYSDTTATRGQSMIFSGWNHVKLDFQNSKVTGYSTSRVYNSSLGSYVSIKKYYKRVGGYTINWACLPEPCLASVASGSNITEASITQGGIIRLDSPQTSYYSTLGSKCVWTFPHCPKTNRQPDVRYYYGSSSSTSFISWGSSNKELTYTGRTTSSSPYRYGMTSLRYQCAATNEGPDKCYSVDRGPSGGTLVTSLTTGQSASITTDAAFTRRSQTCGWTFQCSNSSDKLIFTLDGRMRNSSFTKSSSSRLGHLSMEDGNGVLLHPGIGYSRTSYSSSRPLTVVAPSSKAQLAVKYGLFTANARVQCSKTQDGCYQKSGTVFTPLTSSKGIVVIKSDPNGLSSSTYTTPVGTDCRYTIRCSSGYSLNVSVAGYFERGTQLGFYDTSSGAQVGPANFGTIPRTFTKHNTKNVSFAGYEVDVGWKTNVKNSKSSYGFEIRAWCVKKFSAPTWRGENNKEICNAAKSSYSLSKVAQRVLWRPPKAKVTGCIVNVDCKGVSKAHTMVIAFQMPSSYYSYQSPVEEVFESSTKRLLYNLTSRVSSGTYTSRTGYQNVFVISARNGNQAVLKMRRFIYRSNVEFSVFCLKDDSMVPTPDAQWEVGGGAQSSSRSSSYYSKTFQTDHAMSSFRYQAVASSYSSQKYPVTRQFYRNGIDEYTIFQCGSYRGNYSYGSYARDTTHRMSVRWVKGKIKPESGGDRLRFIDGETGRVRDFADKSYKYRSASSVNIASKVLLVHFRSGNNSGSTPETGFGYQYNVRCGSYGNSGTSYYSGSTSYFHAAVSYSVLLVVAVWMLK